MQTSTSDLKAALRSEALRLGFVEMGVTSPDAIPEAPNRLGQFLDAEYHGEMSWMAERQVWRSNPAALWPEARSVIMLAEAYTPASDPLDAITRRENGTISVYAQNADYHDVLKKKLKALGRWLIQEAGGEIKVFVDTAPVMEKPLAAAAGLGWQGKHTNLLSRTFGNWAFLGALFTTLELPADVAGERHCGKCTACLDICPTDAFPAPYQLDARRCISYLTIEHKGPVDEALRPQLGNRIYGCDDCLAVCPWNKFAAEAQEAKYWARVELAAPRLVDLVLLDDKGFRELFAGSPIKRIGRGRFVRNVCYAIGNSANPAYMTLLQPLTSDSDSVVADAASWALSRLQDAHHV